MSPLLQYMIRQSSVIAMSYDAGPYGLALVCAAYDFNPNCQSVCLLY